MAVIDDDTHAVVSESVEIVTKSDDLRDPPIPSWWYLDIQSKGGYRRLTWDAESPRDDFYKKLVEAMGA
jgi:hypothetical protein